MTDEKMSFSEAKLFFAKARCGVSSGRYTKGSAIFAQGASSDAIFFVQEGNVKITILSVQGKEAVVGLMSPGDFFGEACLTGQPVRIASARATTPCVVIRIDKAAMTKLVHDEPTLSEMFVAHLLAHSVRAESDLIDHLFNSSEKRLARLLLILAKYGKETAPEPILPWISQEMLADMIGTTRSRVSFFMNKFRQLGFIDYKDHIEVHSSLLSVVLTDSDEKHGRRADGEISNVANLR